MTELVLELPASLRGDLKDPLGPIYTDSHALLEAATEPIIAVGDVVTYHLLEAGHTPTVALVDDRTERATVADDIAQRIASESFDRVVEVPNPQGTISAAMVRALASAIDQQRETTLLEVDGEEDLAALPAVVIAPDNASIVYGQPGEGMVLGTVDDAMRDGVGDTISRMDGDSERFWELVDASE